MTYDVNRMMQIAGIPSDEDSAVLTENADVGSDQEVLDEGADEAVILSEASIRDFIRREVKSILTKSAGFKTESEESDSSWIYGPNNQPKMSRRGHVHVGLLGLGFK